MANAYGGPVREIGCRFGEATLFTHPPPHVSSGERRSDHHFDCDASLLLFCFIRVAAAKSAPDLLLRRSHPSPTTTKTFAEIEGPLVVRSLGDLPLSGALACVRRLLFRNEVPPLDIGVQPKTLLTLRDAFVRSTVGPVRGGCPSDIWSELSEL